MSVGFFDSATNEQLRSGTFETDTIEPGATADWNLFASGLGDVEVVCHVVGVNAVTGSGGPEASASPATTIVEAEYPCDLIPQAEIEQLTTNSVEPGDAATNHVTEGDASWVGHECAWLEPSADTPTEVTIDVARADGFPSGAVACPPLSSSDPVPNLGTQASWSWSNPGTAITVGTLRVCSSAALVDVRVSGATSSDAHLAVATAVAEKVLAAL